MTCKDVAGGTALQFIFSMKHMIVPALLEIITDCWVLPYGPMYANKLIICSEALEQLRYLDGQNFLQSVGRVLRTLSGAIVKDCFRNAEKTYNSHMETNFCYLRKLASFHVACKGIGITVSCANRVAGGRIEKEKFV